MSKSKAAVSKGPMANIAPFANVSDDVWKEAQRRRSMLRRLNDLAIDARDEGLETAASVLREAAIDLGNMFFVSEPGRSRLKPRGPKREGFRHGEASAD